MNQRVQSFQKRMLQVMLAAAITLLLWGLVRIQLDGVTHAQVVAAFAQLKGPVRLFSGALRAEPVSLLALGISVLVLTPFMRLLVLTVDFLVQRDWMYVGMSVAVGVIVTISFLLRMH